jgi:hypothetical protein
MLEEYSNKFENVPGMSALSDEQREAAMTVLTAIHKVSVYLHSRIFPALMMIICRGTVLAVSQYDELLS